MKNIWLASFPRSGNTFFRNILFHVYGIESYEDEALINTSGQSLYVIKTHQLPYTLSRYSSKRDKVIYLVRDGRDAVCSIANQRKNLIDEESDFYLNLKEATIAEAGSFFGGWNTNVRFWLVEKPILIRFEDLIRDPKTEFEKFEKILGLPTANWDELPTFEKQKLGKNKFGFFVDNDPKRFSNAFFSKGKVGSWKEEMPKDLQDIFWNESQEMMEALGYTRSGDILTKNEESINYISTLYWSCKIKTLRIIYLQYRVAIRNFKKRILNK